MRINATLEDSVTSFATLVSKYIEEQKNKDLLDVGPPLYPKSRHGHADVSRIGTSDSATGHW